MIIGDVGTYIVDVQMGGNWNVFAIVTFSCSDVMGCTDNDGQFVFMVESNTTWFIHVDG